MTKAQLMTSITVTGTPTTPTRDDSSLNLDTHAASGTLRDANVPLRGHRPGDSPWPGPRPQRILVASDDVVALADLVDAVCAPQREVHSTSSDDVALDLALQLHFDLVVLHLDRPGAGGIEVAHCIRICHELHQPKIVIVTRPLDEVTWTQALHCGADLVLPEPAGVLDTTRALSALLL